MRRFKNLKDVAPKANEVATLSNPSVKTRRNIAIMCVLMALLIMVVPVFAAKTPDIISNAYNWIRTILGYIRYLSLPFAGLLLAWNGFKYMASSDTQESKQVKKNILKIVVALVLIWSITYLITFVGDIVSNNKVSLDMNGFDV